MDPNQRTYERFAHEYTTCQLWPPERIILDRFKTEWRRFRVLDLGVGTGRTSYTFAAVAREYVGVDYAAAMIDGCRATIGETGSVHFQVADARDLSRFADGSFDFVLFCWNGIDAVGHDDRLCILREVRRVLRADGHFFFSTHTIYDFPFLEDPPRIDAGALVRSTYRRTRALLRNAALRWKYRKLDPAVITQQPYAILTPPDHDFGIDAYYIRPDRQPDQLRDAGFQIVTTYDQHGGAVDPMTTRHRGYLYFLSSPLSC